MSAPFFAPRFAASNLTDALPIERAAILAFDGYFFARVESGSQRGVVALGEWTPALVSLWQRVVLPFWIGRDARDLEGAIAEIHARHQAWASAPFWTAVSAIELASWDLLGQISGRGVAELLRDKPRRKMPVYLCSPRQTTPAAEIEALAPTIERTGARGAKLKIGGGEPNDARDRALLQAARRAWGDKFTLYADAQGTLDAETAIEIGPLLREYKIAWFEEPCPWQEFEATRLVAAGVQLPVAGGRWQSSWPLWKWALENCALDVAQPDLHGYGGLGRSFALSQFAARLGVLTAPVVPASGPRALPALHFAAALEKPAPLLEWDASAPGAPSWFGSPLEIRKGAVALPKAPGWGALYDEEIWKRAEILASASV